MYIYIYNNYICTTLNTSLIIIICTNTRYMLRDCSSNSHTSLLSTHSFVKLKNEKEEEEDITRVSGSVLSVFQTFSEMRINA